MDFFFCKNKTEIRDYSPTKMPSYFDGNLSPYGEYMEQVVGTDEKNDPYHFGWSIIDNLSKNNRHEIATHTFSHYYCGEAGQNIEEFEEDLMAAIKVAQAKGIHLNSIVLPRNQVIPGYLTVCAKHGIKSYRDNENFWAYKTDIRKRPLGKRFFRLLDSYINLSGHNCYSYEYMSQSSPYKIPSSRFLRPYNSKIKALDGLRLKRIKSSMTYAAKNHLVYHLWWHPHNFGINQQENLAFLEKILIHYMTLNKSYGFESRTMGEISETLSKNYGK